MSPSTPEMAFVPVQVEASENDSTISSLSSVSGFVTKRAILAGLAVLTAVAVLAIGVYALAGVAPTCPEADARAGHDGRQTEGGFQYLYQYLDSEIDEFVRRHQTFTGEHENIDIEFVVTGKKIEMTAEAGKTFKQIDNNKIELTGDAGIAFKHIKAITEAGGYYAMTEAGGCYAKEEITRLIKEMGKASANVGFCFEEKGVHLNVCTYSPIENSKTSVVFRYSGKKMTTSLVH